MLTSWTYARSNNTSHGKRNASTRNCTFCPIRRSPSSRAATNGPSSALITGAGAVLNAAKMPTGATAAIVGCGGVGLNALLAAKMLGAERLIAIDHDIRKLDHARKLGATDTFQSDDPKCVENVRDATDGG